MTDRNLGLFSFVVGVSIVLSVLIALFSPVTILALSLPALGIFAYRYARYSPWRNTYLGRATLAQKIAWMVLVGHFLAKEFWHYPGWEVVEAVVMGSVAVLFYVLLWSLLKAQNSSRPVPKEQGQGFVMPEDVERTNPRSYSRFLGR